MHPGSRNTVRSVRYLTFQVSPHLQHCISGTHLFSEYEQRQCWLLLMVPRQFYDILMSMLVYRHFEMPIDNSSLQERVVKNWNGSSAVLHATAACRHCGKSQWYALWREPVSCTL
jgi:hypothetical protein